MEEISIDKPLLSGDRVDFVISGYLGDEISSDIITLTVPKFPALINKTLVTVEPSSVKYRFVPGATTGSYTVTGYGVNYNYDSVDESLANFIVTTSTTPTKIVVNDELLFSFTDPGISHLNGIIGRVTSVNPTKKQIAFRPLKTLLSPLTNGSVDLSLTGTNKVFELTTKVPFAREFVIRIEEARVYQNLTYNDDYRHIPIFAYTKTANTSQVPTAQKYLFAGNGSTEISSITPPDHDSISYFAKKQSYSTFLTNLEDTPIVRFYVAIAAYRRKPDNTWVGAWLQRDKDRKAIWRQARPKVIR